jgi:hypothetical protein
MSTVVLSPSNVANFVEGGGHFWVYMQYVHGLRALGCEVYWLERFRRGDDSAHDAAVLSTFFRQMERYGMGGGRTILYCAPEDGQADTDAREYIGVTRQEAEAVIRRADLLLNFLYSIDPALLARFRRTALVDIDPGLLQFWIGAGQLTVPRHDVYFTIGETVGAPGSRIGGCGLDWIHIRPPVALGSWPTRIDSSCEAFTTISNWYGGDGTGTGCEWIVARDGTSYENTKRISFLNFIELPRRTDQRLELALCFGPEEAEERPLLARSGWRIRRANEVACSPERYQAYIQQSRGEFSCAKPSCSAFQNAWISDRSLCYLASGKPVVVQNTGPSAFLPFGEGIFRFETIGEAVEALAIINADYERHCRAARAIAEAYFDATDVASTIVSRGLS